MILIFAISANSTSAYENAIANWHGGYDEEGDYTGEGEYDEDEAVEYLLDALLRAFPLDDAGSVRYCALIDAFLPLFDDYLLSAGLLSL